MRKGMFFVFLLGLTLFAAMDCSSTAVDYGWVDYSNLFFCNAEQYPLYDRTVWQMSNVLFFMAMINTGIYFLSESHYQFSRGFRSLVLLRYQKIDRYLWHVIGFSVRETLAFFGFVFVDIVAVLLIFDRDALTVTSLLLPLSAWETAAYMFCYAVKIMVFYLLVQLTVSYGLLSLPYEPLLIGGILGTTILLFADIRFNTHFVTLALNGQDILYASGYLLLLLGSGWFVSKRFQKKEW